MTNKNTIKAEVKNQFKGLKVTDVQHRSFGIFVVKVEKQMPRSVKIGLIFGETDFDKTENGVVLDKKIDWI
tara:strand:+ start:137 stop:349 length:213 start_codon:yes stop_codon:yes gene_type:complete